MYSLFITYGHMAFYCPNYVTRSVLFFLPFGAKSIGEVVINTPLPAVSDAIFNATGTRFYELPITPEKIAMAVAEREKEQA